jgi:prepilin-type N-terminal cleavage/methylation domain-containing protein
MNYSVSFKNKSRAFTLVELIVVMTITTIILTSLVIQQNAWNDQLSVKTQAYELVMMIRQAQIYSLGVREDVGGSGDKFSVGYGVYLSVTGAEKAVLFADRDGDQEYDSPGEKIEEKTLTRGVIISKVCEIILSPCTGNGPKKVNITFLRPNPGARFVFRTATEVKTIVGPAYIKVTPVSGSDIILKIEANGQISIQ